MHLIPTLLSVRTDKGARISAQIADTGTQTMTLVKASVAYVVD
jgi:hypothetical protein